MKAAAAILLLSALILLAACTAVHDLSELMTGEERASLDTDALRAVFEDPAGGGGAAEPELHKPQVVSLKTAGVAGVKAGPNYRLDPAVIDDGFMYYFRIRTSFGDLDAYGRRELAYRIAEIPAMAQLRNVESSGRLLESMQTAAGRSYRQAWDFASRPVESIEALPGALYGIFQAVGARAQKLAYRAEEFYYGGESAGADQAAKGARPPDKLATPPGEAAATPAGVQDFRREEVLDEAWEFAEGYSEHYFGYDKAKRRLALALNVDPYSSNRLLQKELTRVAGIDLSASILSSFIPGVAVINYMARADRLVWEEEQETLVAQGYRELRESGVSSAITRQLLSNPCFTRTEVSRLVRFLKELKDVPQAGLAAELAAGAASPAAAGFYTDALELLAMWRGTYAFKQLMRSGRLITAVWGSGKAFVPLPLDHLSLNKTVVNWFTHLKRDFPGGGVMVLRGSASTQLKSRLSAAGWKLIELHENRAVSKNPGAFLSETHNSARRRAGQFYQFGWFQR